MGWFWSCFHYTNGRKEMLPQMEEDGARNPICDDVDDGANNA